MIENHRQHLLKICVKNYITDSITTNMKLFLFNYESVNVVNDKAEQICFRQFYIALRLFIGNQIIFSQNLQSWASVWRAPPLGFSFWAWIAGMGLYDWPVALYMAWTHNILSCSSSLANITVSPSLTALKNIWPPWRPVEEERHHQKLTHLAGFNFIHSTVSWQRADLIVAAQCFKWLLVENQTHNPGIAGKTIRERFRFPYPLGS